MKEELLNLIDKIVGKKDIMRSPAWWVNRIFKKTLDYSEEYADKVTKDVESRVNSKTDALDSGKEDKIMTVYVPSILGDAYQPWMTKENKRFYEEVKAGRCHICKIAVNPKGLLDFYMIGSPMWSVEKVYVGASFYWGSSNDLPDVIFRLIVIDSDGDADQINSTSYNLLHNTSLKTINKQSLIGSGNIEIGAEVVDNLESESTTAALSANQGRVLKEMIEELPSESVEQQVLTIYALPSSLKTQIDTIAGQEPLKGLINEMHTHNAEVYSKIVESRNKGEESPIICVDSRKYVQKILESLQNIPPGTLITSTRVTAQMVFSNFDLLKGSSMEDCVNIIYESVIDGLAERIILRPDGSYEADSLFRLVYYYDRGESELTEANIASNKFIYDNWLLIYSHFSRYIQGAVQKSGSDGRWAGRYLISVDTEAYNPKFCVIEAGGTIKEVSINESGLPSITAL